MDRGSAFEVLIREEGLLVFCDFRKLTRLWLSHLHLLKVVGHHKDTVVALVHLSGDRNRTGIDVEICPLLDR